jgi:hypothetical protein
VTDFKRFPFKSAKDLYLPIFELVIQPNLLLLFGEKLVLLQWYDLGQPSRNRLYVFMRIPGKSTYRRTHSQPSGPPTTSPRHAFCFLSPARRMQQRAITDDPERPTYLPPAFLRHDQTDVDSHTSKVHTLHIRRSVLWGVHLQASNTRTRRALNCQHAVTAKLRFPWNSFKYFSPSFQSSFHLSFTLLLRYGSPRNI